MQLTPAQRRVVRFYRDHRDAPPTLGEFFRRGAKWLLFQVVYAAVAGYYFWSIGVTWLGTLMVGLVVGAMLREFRTWLWTMRVWPVDVALTDWKRVDELGEEDAGRTLS